MPAVANRRIATIRAAATIVQDGRQPASSRKRPSSRVPCSVCITSGWNWTPNIRRSASSTAATGVAFV